MRQKSARILVISTMYPSELHPSFGIFVKNQVLALRDLGYDVDVAAVRNPHTNNRNLIKKYGMWLLSLIGILLFKGKQYDIIHAHYVFPSGLPALLFKKIFKQKVIVTAHGGDLEKMAVKGPFFFKITKEILQQADSVIAVGPELESQILNDYGIEKEKLHLLNMGVDRETFTNRNKGQCRQALGLCEENNIILFIGNLIKAKGITELIGAHGEMTRSYPNTDLHLIGASKEPDVLKDMINDSNQQVYIHPPTSQHDIALWINAADVLVLPSHMEGFGLVALEAMSCHTPVVGTRVGGLKYLLADGAGVVVEPQDIPALQHGIESVLKDSNLRDKLINKGEEKAKVFDHRRILNQLQTIYHE